jgi:uncharacterized membrane protein YgcG
MHSRARPDTSTTKRTLSGYRTPNRSRDVREAHGLISVQARQPSQAIVNSTFLKMASLSFDSVSPWCHLADRFAKMRGMMRSRPRISPALNAALRLVIAPRVFARRRDVPYDSKGKISSSGSSSGSGRSGSSSSGSSSGSGPSGSSSSSSGCLSGSNPL